MRNPFTFKASVFKWVGLLIGSVVLAVGLAYSLDFSGVSLLPSGFSLTQSESVVSVKTAQSNFALQNRYGRRWLHYATVSRSDDSFRQMFITADDVERVEAGHPLPDNTLILMESWYSSESPGIVFIKQKLNGSWQYGSFNPSQPDYQLSDRASCQGCHAPFSGLDFTLTKPLLEAALQTQQLQTAYCDRAGRSPCDPEAYLPESF